MEAKSMLVYMFLFTVKLPSGLFVRFLFSLFYLTLNRNCFPVCVYSRCYYRCAQHDLLCTSPWSL